MPDDQRVKNGIPSQRRGNNSDTLHSVKYKTRQEAVDFFPVVKNRLLDVSHWDELCGAVTAIFTLTDSLGNKVSRLAITGDHLRIDIPAPGSKSGDGYDWVQVEAIDHNKDVDRDFEELSMRVRPAKNPKHPDEEVSHFFKEDATSTFRVSRKGNVLRAGVHGRNELPNTSQQSLWDKIRNAFIALGAMLGLSFMQWRQLVKGLLSADKGNIHPG